MKSLALKIAVLFFLTGIAITLFLGYVERKTISTYDNNLPYLNLAAEVKNRVSQGHLALEEYLANDGTINIDNDVLGKFASSNALLQAAYDGKDSEFGAFKKTDNEEVRAVIKETVNDIDKLAVAAQERIAKKGEVTVTVDTLGVSHSEPAPVDPMADVRFDTQYDAVQGSLVRLTELISQVVAADRKFIDLISWISIGSLFLIVVALAIVLYRLQRRNEVSSAETSKRLERQARSVTSLSAFIEAISVGNFAVDINMEGDEGLRHTLITMRDKLRDNAEDDRKRNWSTSGLAQIGEILRSHTNSTEELYDNILKFVVKYTDSNQGGLFLLSEEETDKHLDLVACYAFERKKYLQKKVAIGEGMIGQCFLEGERIYLLDVPNEYITITSGLGGSNPSALLIIPLKVNEKIFGVLELASFSKYEDYEIELVEKLAETIASTISTVRVNESTRILLEKTQQQAEEMRAQEEEMRQNMEELEATQEEMRRKEKHIQLMLDGEKQRNEFNNKNRQIVLTLSKTKEILEGKWDEGVETMVSSVGKQMKASRTSIWMFDAAGTTATCEKLYSNDRGGFESGKQLFEQDAPVFFRTLKSEKNIIAKDAATSNETKELADIYLRPLGIQSVLAVPFFNEGKVAGFITCEQQHTAYDWTEDHVEFLKSLTDLITVTLNTVRINDMLTHLSESQGTLQTIIDNLPRAVFWKDRDLRIQGCNKIFAAVAGLDSHLDMIGKTDFDMPWRDRAEEYRADDKSVMDSGVARIDQEERLVNSEGAESWVLTSKVPVLNQQGEVVAVLGMFEDITERKKRDLDVKAKLEELEHLKKMLENQKN
jgi:PAS domain S-box-containing protein